MSVLRINAEITSLNIVWGVFILFLSTSFLICLIIIVRRLVRNRTSQIRSTQKKAFDEFLSQSLIKKSETPKLRDAPDCHILDMTEIFLHYFRTLRGEKNDHLIEMIVGSSIEDQIIQSTYSGVRGNRMAGVRILAYLNSQKSLQVIFKNLSSEDKYVRLTAARSLVRRDGLLYLSSIIDALVEAFPDDPKLLAGILAEFGSRAVALLESAIKNTGSAAIKTACLEALVIIMPPQTSLNLGQLMESPDEKVRAATLSLSSVAKHTDQSDPIRLGLQDKKTSVKMRAVKIANDLKRSDLTPELYALSTDPVMWVRYWALKAIWATGTSGEKFVTTLADSHEMAKNVATEISSGYV